MFGPAQAAAIKHTRNVNEHQIPFISSDNVGAILEVATLLVVKGQPNRNVSSYSFTSDPVNLPNFVEPNKFAMLDFLDAEGGFVFRAKLETRAAKSIDCFRKVTEHKIVGLSVVAPDSFQVRHLH